MKKTIALVLSMALALCLLAGCGSKPAAEPTAAPAAEPAAAAIPVGDKLNFKIHLVDQEGAAFDYDLSVTKGANLRDALFEAGLIDEENHVGMFVQTIDGHTANVMDDGATWLPTDEQGQQIMGFFEEILPAEGSTITLTYYIVPDMD